MSRRPRPVAHVLAVAALVGLAAPRGAAAQGTEPEPGESETDRDRDVFGSGTGTGTGTGTGGGETDRDRDVFGSGTGAGAGTGTGTGTGTGFGEGDRAGPESLLGDREDALFGGEGGARGISLAGLEDILAIGGRLYLRLSASFADEEAFGKQSLAMPNLLDVYLDARPDPHVRAFFSGRLSYDPTVEAGSTDAYGNEREQARVLVDQLWIKTDIARYVFLTVGQQRIKWGASRIWNPTDFVNRTRRSPLSFFDERTGVPAIKVHVPIEVLGWNLYALVLFDGAHLVERIGAAGRLEIATGPVELTFSAAGGKGRKTSVGADFSFGLWDFDLHAELALTDEHGTTDYHLPAGAADPDDVIATMGRVERTRRNAWYARVSAGIDYAFKPTDDDVVTLAFEYFYNPLGESDPALYPAMILGDDFQPFYVGQHYAALAVFYPSPGTWDEATLSLTTLGNLSDLTFVSRLALSVMLHRHLGLEAYVQVYYGDDPGELRYGLDVPEIPTVTPAIHVVPPRAGLGLNLRVSI